MTCKEKIDKIEKILDDEYETKIERIREVVDDAEDKEISLKKIKKAREEMAKLTTPPQYHDEDYYICGVDDCLEILDKLIAESE